MAITDGFNTRFDYKGAKFHVQTQDKGLSARCVETLIYKAGELLTSRKTFYTALIDAPNLKRTVAQIMEDQHKAVIQEIADGRFDRFLGGAEGST